MLVAVSDHASSYKSSRRTTETLASSATLSYLLYPSPFFSNTEAITDRFSG
jgi:hypothetical protein